MLLSPPTAAARVHQFFALPNQSGLPDVLTDERLHDGRGPASAMETRIAGELWSVAKYLWVIVSRPASPQVAALLGSDAMRRLLEVQRDNFDFIILDSPPALAAADALALAPLVDADLGLADSGSTTRNAAAHHREQLEQVGGRVLGAVLNRDRSSPGAYHYEA